jgi:hypothetical protein
MSTATGFAVYDTTLARFVTGVHDTAAKAEAEAPKAPKGHKYDTRKV